MRLARKTGVALLAASTMLTGAACGTSPSKADQRSATAPAASPGSVHQQLRGLEKSFQGWIGAYAIDTGTGKSVGYRAHQRFPSNSTFKAPLCGAILKKARTTDPGLMSRVIHYTQKDVDGKGHAPVTGQPENIKNGLSVAKLCEATITESDNPAANLLLRQIGGPKGFTRYYRSLGDPVGRLDRYEPELNRWTPGEKRDTIMPAFMAKNLRKLTLGTALAPQDRAQMVAWLKANKTGDKRVRAGLPGWTVGDKTGSADGWHAAAHDIAIAWPPSGGAPLIITVYTNRRAKDAAIDDTVVAKTAAILARSLGKTA